MFLERLVAYWQNQFDWRRIEAGLNAFPQVRVRCDGLWIHAIHLRSQHQDAIPIILTHGWPGSFIEYLEVARRLSNPVAYGGDARNSFHVVLPSLPGFGFSQWRPGLEIRAIAQLWLQLMSAFGYARFAAQGGDWGAGVSTELALIAPERLVGVHLNYVMRGHLLPLKASGKASEGPSPAFAPEELAYYKDTDRFAAAEGGYAHIQGTKPQSLAYALNDSPAGLAGYIIEKFRTWSDCNGDLESIFTLDQLLTNVSIYWYTESVATSMRIYRERNLRPSSPPRTLPEVPFGIAEFPKELARPPRQLIERSFKVSRFTRMYRGGHFAAFEQPALFTEDVQAFFGSLR